MKSIDKIKQKHGEIRDYLISSNYIPEETKLTLREFQTFLHGIIKEEQEQEKPSENPIFKVVTVNKVDFSDLFNWTTKYYDIDWNDCNDLYFHHGIRYKGYTDVWLGKTKEEFAEIEFEKENLDYNKKVEEYTKQEILDIECNYLKASLLVEKFLSYNLLEEAQIESD